MEILPKHGWVIEVNICLKHWQEDLQGKSDKMKKAVSENNGDVLKELFSGRIRRPRDIALNKFLYENMPSWFREIWISGAQYYYDAIASIQYLWSDKEGPNFNLAKGLSERCDESTSALFALREFIDKMIPPVILETPASISEKEFLRQD